AYGLRKKAGETSLALVVRPEPKVPWHFLQHLDVTSARDELNQAVKVSRVLEDRPLSEDPYALRQLARSSYISSLPADLPTPGVPVSVARGGDLGKVLKEMHGKIEAQVQGLPRALLTVDNILKAEGKSTQDEEGGTWKVTRVKEQGDGGV